MTVTEGLKREEGRNTVKNVDDLLIYAQDEVTCVADTVTLEPSGERGSQGQSDKTTGCEAGNNFFWVTL